MDFAENDLAVRQLRWFTSILTRLILALLHLVILSVVIAGIKQNLRINSTVMQLRSLEAQTLHRGGVDAAALLERVHPKADAVGLLDEGHDQGELLPGYGDRSTVADGQLTPGSGDHLSGLAIRLAVDGRLGDVHLTLAKLDAVEGCRGGTQSGGEIAGEIEAVHDPGEVGVSRLRGETLDDHTSRLVGGVDVDGDGIGQHW